MNAMSPRTVAELRLRHAQLADTAQRLRDRSLVADPTRPASAALSREVRQTQIRADDYARVLELLDRPTLERMEEEDVAAALTASGFRGVAADVLEPGLVLARDTMSHLFDHWRAL